MGVITSISNTTTEEVELNEPTVKLEKIHDGEKRHCVVGCDRTGQRKRGSEYESRRKGTCQIAGRTVTPGGKETTPRDVSNIRTCFICRAIG